MADGSPDDGPSLEMPSLSLRRRRKPPAAEAPERQAPEHEAPEPEAPAPEAPAPEAPESEPALDPVPETHPDGRRRPERPAIPLSGLPAAAVTGVVVGGLAVLVGWLAGLGCSALRGTSSCGGAAGLPMLVVALVVLAWVGAVLLRLVAVREPGSTSLLAVGILAVLVMVFLLGSLDEWWAAVVVPVASLMAYAVSWWVTTAVSSDGRDPVGARPPYDVR